MGREEYSFGLGVRKVAPELARIQESNPRSCSEMNDRWTDFYLKSILTFDTLLIYIPPLTECMPLNSSRHMRIEGAVRK